jgi:hypothetical protein
MSVLDFMEEKKQTKKRKITSEPDLEMKKFTCTSCSKEFFDMNLYFYDRPSTKCMWCSKFPKPVKKPKEVKS